MLPADLFFAVVRGTRRMIPVRFFPYPLNSHVILRIRIEGGKKEKAIAPYYCGAIALTLDGWTSSKSSGQQTHDEQHQEHKEQNLRDLDRAAGDDAETKHSGYQRDHEKYRSPI